MGRIDAWFYQTLAGIQPDESRPFFERIVIRPFIPDSLSFVRASAQTMRGRVAVEWTTKHGLLQLHVTIPANSSATVHVPAATSGQARNTPSLKPVRFEAGAAGYEIGSGDYEFQSALRTKTRCP